MSEKEDSASPARDLKNEIEDLYSIIQRLYLKVENNTTRITNAGA